MVYTTFLFRGAIFNGRSVVLNVWLCCLFLRLLVGLNGGLCVELPFNHREWFNIDIMIVFQWLVLDMVAGFLHRVVKCTEIKIESLRCPFLLWWIGINFAIKGRYCKLLLPCSLCRKVRSTRMSCFLLWECWTCPTWNRGGSARLVFYTRFGSLLQGRTNSWFASFEWNVWCWFCGLVLVDVQFYVKCRVSSTIHRQGRKHAFLLCFSFVFLLNWSLFWLCGLSLSAEDSLLLLRRKDLLAVEGPNCLLPFKAVISSAAFSFPFDRLLVSRFLLYIAFDWIKKKRGIASCFYFDGKQFWASNGPSLK